MFISETDWRKTVNNPEEIRIFEALEDPRWQWRTVKSLARQSELSEQFVFHTLNKYPEFIRRARLRRPNSIQKVPRGASISRRAREQREEIYTLRQRYYKRLSPLEKLWFFSDSTSAG